MIANAGLAEPPELEKAYSGSLDQLNWMKRNARTHENRHVRAICVERYMEKGENQKDYHQFIGEMAKGEEPLAVYAVAKTILELKHQPVYGTLRTKHRKTLLTNLEKLAVADKTPDYLKTQLGQMNVQLR